MNGENSSNEPLPALAVYNPSLLKKEELIAQFIARRPLLDRLVEDLRRCGGKSGCQHHLIVGPRGSGKTTLLRRLRYAIEDDAELSARWVPLVFPEEQYNVSRLSDLWVNCLDALSDMLERRQRETEAEALDELIENLPADDEKRRTQAALDLLIGWAKQQNRELVLLFDNSDLIFDRLSSDHWAIREVLSADNHLLFIGATSAPIEATYDHKGAFYDFFKIHEIRGLNDAETREVLLNLARLRKTPRVIELLEREPGRIRSLNLLTGGNLRTIIVLYQVLASGTDDSIRTDLEQLLDQYTPLYKHRFESLSPQLQQIVDALALNWDPTSAAVLAEKLRLETNVVSAGLNRLANDGVVEKAPSPPGEKMFFQITERFFNIWYLMRASRRVRRKLLWLVEFLKMFYGASGLRQRARRLVRSHFPGRNQSHRAELALAYARAVKDPALRRALETEGVRSLMGGVDGGRHSFKAIFDLDGEDASLKDIVDRFQTLGALSEKIEQAKGNLSAELWDRLIAAPSMSLEEKKKTAEEIAKLGTDECKPWIEKFTAEAELLADKFGAESCRELFDAIRSGDMADGADVEGADAAAIKWNDASLKVIARIAKFEATQDKTLLDEIEKILAQVKSPHLWLSWAETLAGSNGDQEKLNQAYERIIALEGHDACTWHRVGRLLKYDLKRYAEAEAAYRKSIEMNPKVARVWDGLGHLLTEFLNRFDEAEAAFRKAIELDPTDAEPWDSLGDLKKHLDQYKEAEEAYRKAIQLDPSEGAYWNDLGNLLKDHLNRYGEAEEAYRKAIELDLNEALYWNNLGLLFHYGMKERFEEAEEAYRKAIELNPSEQIHWNDLGDLLVDHLSRYSEAKEAYSKAIELDSSNGSTWNDLGGLLTDYLKRYDEAEAACRKAIELNPEEAIYWNNFGYLLSAHLKRYDEAEEVFRKAIELDPKEAIYWANLGRLLHYAMKERFEEAEKAYRKAIELDPKEAWFWKNLGDLLTDPFSRYSEAEEAYRKAIELNPQGAWFWNALGTFFHYSIKERFEEAEEEYRKAIELAPNEAIYWDNLGDLLADYLHRNEEAEEAFRKAMEIAPEEAERHNSLAWRLYLRNKELGEAEVHSRRAVELEPDELNCAHTHACVLAKRGKWEEALPFARKFIQEGDDEYHESIWPEIVMFFRDAVATNHTENAVALLDETEYGERWRPLREALQAIAEDDSTYLLRVAPEVRQPAEEIVALLLPEGVKLGTSPKPARARQTRRRRSLS
ncbi:MAG: tetratricopeptide repeat protein [Acidobacteria bacterium]|nr:tetratricopeptide repeat protein [Acidobacteriota bacterium]